MEPHLHNATPAFALGADLGPGPLVTLTRGEAWGSLAALARIAILVAAVLGAGVWLAAVSF